MNKKTFFLASVIAILFGASAFAQVKWVPGKRGDAVPANAIFAGDEPHVVAPRKYYVCRAKHGNGVHPGKLTGGECNIGYGGAEVVKAKYEVAVYSGGSWGRKTLKGALVGGHENGRTLYVCRYELIDSAGGGPAGGSRGTHAGKRLPDRTCHIGYGTEEYSSPNYQLFYP